MNLSVNGQRFVVTDLHELRARLATVRDRQWSELDIGVDEDPGAGGTFFGLIALVNGERSLLVYFRYSGDPGLTSRDPTYTGPAAATLDFELSNGQADDYPVAWTVPTVAALPAIEYAFLNRAPAPWITWEEACQPLGSASAS